METTASTARLVLDPLIAEAKGRARRRRTWIAAAVVAAAVVALVPLTVLRPFSSASVSARPAWLHDAMVRGTLVAFNRRTAVAELRISCGWHTRGSHTAGKVQPGLYRVPLQGGLVNEQAGVDPRVPGSGHANEMKVWKWERGWPRGWSPRGRKVWLTVHGKAYMSDGPSWDICGGAFP